MEDYISLQEIYVYNSTLFKPKSLKSFLRTQPITEDDYIKKGSKIEIKAAWVKQHMPAFDQTLQTFTNEKSKVFEVSSIIKNFNPIQLNMDSSCVKYLSKDGKRTPFFTIKGYIKVMALHNTIPDQTLAWISELMYGRLQQHLDSLEDVVEMVSAQHVPIVKVINDEWMLSDTSVTEYSDVIVDFRKVGQLKKEQDKNINALEKYKCPIYKQMKTSFDKRVEEVQIAFKTQLKEIEQKHVIQSLHQELDKEKSLKDQAISLTQSFVPNFDKRLISPIDSPPCGKRAIQVATRCPSGNERQIPKGSGTPNGKGSLRPSKM